MVSAVGQFVRRTFRFIAGFVCPIEVTALGVAAGAIHEIVRPNIIGVDGLAAIETGRIARRGEIRLCAFALKVSIENLFCHFGPLSRLRNVDRALRFPRWSPICCGTGP